MGRLLDPDNAGYCFNFMYLELCERLIYSSSFALEKDFSDFWLIFILACEMYDFVPS